MSREPYGEFEMPDIRPVVPEVDRKDDPDLPPAEIGRIIDSLDRGEEPGMPEAGIVHEDRHDVPDIDRVIDEKKKSRG